MQTDLVHTQVMVVQASICLIPRALTFEDALRGGPVNIGAWVALADRTYFNGYVIKMVLLHRAGADSEGTIRSRHGSR